MYRTVEISDVKSSRPKWPRGQNFGLGLGLKHFGLGLASISLSYYAIGHFSGKNRVKFGNFVNFFYRAMHFSAKRGIAIACRLSVRL